MTTKAMPLQGIDLKEGVYRTPEIFMNEVRKSFDIHFDLAADGDNAQAPNFLGLPGDSLNSDWAGLTDKWCWLNPPYDDIGKWAEKCAIESCAGAKILLLVPASVGSNWYRNYVEDFAGVLFLTGRLVFDFRYPADYMDRMTIKINAGRRLEGLPPIACERAGKMNKDPYPKDLLLAVFNKELDHEDRRPRTWAWSAYL